MAMVVHNNTLAVCRAGSDPGSRALLRNISGRSVTSEPAEGVAKARSGYGWEGIDAAGPRRSGSPPRLPTLRRGARTARRLHASGSSPALATSEIQVSFLLEKCPTATACHSLGVLLLRKSCRLLKAMGSHICTTTSEVSCVHKSCLATDVHVATQEHPCLLSLS